MMTVLRSLKRGLPLLIALSSVSCTSILSGPKSADIVYRLKSNTEAVMASEEAVIIRVDVPLSPRALRTTDILVAPDSTQLASLSGGQWSEVIPVLVQRALVDKMAGSSKVVGVLPQSGARTAYRVNIDIRSFEARFDQGENAAPLAVVDYHVTVSDAMTRKLVGMHAVYKTQRADAARVSAIVAAQDMANDDALEAIVVWLGELL